MGTEEMEQRDSAALFMGGLIAPIATQFRIFQRSMLWGSLLRSWLLWKSSLWKSLFRRAGGKRNRTLAVRETAALGDRRFISVIQFESRRFLIGSSPSAITLLAQLPDEPAGGNGRDAGAVAREEN
jgi:hypothetical protein